MMNLVVFIFRLSAWWLIIEAIGFVMGINLLPFLDSFLPSLKRFREIHPISYFIIVKQLGFLLLTGLVFITGTITGLPWKLITILILIIFLGSAIKQRLFINFKPRPIIRQFFASIVPLIILSILRVMTPLYDSTEKPMDYVFISNFLKQDTLPFQNPWLKGVILNYYYLGQFLISILLYVTRISPEIGYNLFIGIIAVWILQTTYAFLEIVLFILRIDFKKTVKPFIVFAVVFGGNLYSVSKLITHGKYFYPDPTRVVPNAINEFPSYSIFLGDLHAHYINIAFTPVVWAIVYFILTTFLSWLRTRKQTAGIKHLLLALLLGVSLTTPLLINSWDIVPTAFLILSLILPLTKEYKSVLKIFKNPSKALLKLSPLFLTALGGLINIFLFQFYFMTPSKGFAFKPHNDFYYYLILWGQFLIPIIISLLIGLFVAIFYKKRALIASIGRISPFIIMGVLNILWASFIHLKGPFYGGAFYRANTVFKMYYAVWIPLGIIAFTLLPYALSMLVKTLPYSSVLRILSSLLLTAFILIPLPYFIVAFNDVLDPGIIDPTRYHAFKDKVKRLPESLDGTQYLHNISQGEYIIKKILTALTKSRNATILEITDWKSYSTFARMCTTTGNTCIIGWPLHPYQWHNGHVSKGFNYKTKRIITIDIPKRVEEIQRFYKHPYREIIEKYSVDFVVLAQKEIEFQRKNGVNPYTWIQNIQKLCPVNIKYEIPDKDFSTFYIFICE